MIKKIKNLKGDIGFEMIIKIIIAIAVLVFVGFLISGTRISMLDGIRRIFTFGR